MDFNIIDNEQGLLPLADEWNNLLSSSITNVPFLRHEYLAAWWRGRGGGEWPRADLFTVTARRADRLVGLAPTFRTANEHGQPTLMLLGSIEISDYLDLLVPATDLPAFLSGLMDHLAALPPDAWRSLDWVNLPQDSPTLPALEKESQKRGWKLQVEPFRPVVSVPLTGDFDTYLAGIDKKQRHEIRRKMRRAAEYDLPVRWYIEDGTHLEQAASDFLNLMAGEAEKARFLTPEMRQQMAGIIHATHQAGHLQLAFLEVDGRKAAGYLNFDYNDRIWVYNSGIDRHFMDLSPGWVLLGHLLQWANENRRAEFDFMRGGEDYKYKFGGRQALVMRALLERAS